jgi:SAM-dependent methyltransferase
MSRSDNLAPQKPTGDPHDSNPSGDSVEIRPWGRTDVEAIRKLAGIQSNFTIPSKYQLEFLHHGDPELNLVATSTDGTILGYLLTLWSSPGELFLWQIARNRETAELQRLSGTGVQRLLEEFAANVKRTGACALQFTMNSDSVARWVRRLAPQLLGHKVRELHFKVDGERAYEIRFSPVPHGLTDVYDIPGFSDFVHRVFSPEKISSDWLRVLSHLNSHDYVLEVGAGDGRLTSHLLGTGARVVAVEPCRSFDPRKGCLLGSPAEEKLRVVRGYFPTIPTDKFSCIVLHQNVFTELVNQMDEGDLIVALKSFLAPGGRLLFDFVTDLDVGPVGQIQPIFHGPVTDLGNVVYEREFLGRHWGMRYETMLKFSYERNGIRQLQSLRVEARFPELDTVLRQMGAQGGQLSVHPIDAFTFFPGKPRVIEALFLH